MTERRPILEIDGVTKTFPGVVANDDVSLTLNEGEIHCLLGENGAGKSVLMSIVFGLYQPDSGHIRVRGEFADFKGTAEAIEHGVGMVHQHFQLIPVFTVAENIVLGDEITRGPVLDMDSARDRIREISETHGLAIDPDAVVGDLSVGVQQRVELIKALYRDADILILDEPTAVLTPGEADNFFEVVRSLAAEGKSIIFITHKLREVLALADAITVLRQGKVAGSVEPSEATEASLAKLMVGRDVVLRVDKGAAEVGETVLRVENLSIRDDRDLPAVDDLSLEVHAGEIFGIAGVEGNGQRELVEGLAGMRPKHGGTVRLGQLDITKMSVRKIAEHGVGHVPEDRNKHGLVSEFTVADNAVLNHYRRKEFLRHGLRDEGPSVDTPSVSSRNSTYEQRVLTSPSRPVRGATNKSSSSLGSSTPPSNVYLSHNRPAESTLGRSNLFTTN